MYLWYLPWYTNWVGTAEVLVNHMGVRDVLCEMAGEWVWKNVCSVHTDRCCTFVATHSSNYPSYSWLQQTLVHLQLFPKICRHFGQDCVAFLRSNVEGTIITASQNGHLWDRRPSTGSFHRHNRQLSKSVLRNPSQTVFILRSCACWRGGTISTYTEVRATFTHSVHT